MHLHSVSRLKSLRFYPWGPYCPTDKEHKGLKMGRLPPHFFKRSAARGLLLRFGAASSTRIHIGDHVMAERRVVRRGRQVDSPAREADRLVEVTSEIEVQLRKVQMPFGECRIDGDRLTVRVELRVAISKLSVQFAKI